ncbi:MAG: hypothetical protein AVDCRST_MAG67-1036 [uncultured Solirubrobacteraceae bacterium]|uniref:Uncharacterized protein n=1 Tax=uncultured Solirubrobacteraceae bacterium TaxID=1162706 RepID=A0A6J4S6T9_9ACTN|nr:MAG: hypothetical protein AVDCRST_MAG67-1036 [uncultured Solirubrobacteraceae bacterium]
MVRRPSAVLTSRRRPGPVTLALAVPLAALVYFLAAPALPALPAGDVTILVAGGIGVALVAATALALLPASETLIGPLLIVLGSGLLVAALNSEGQAGVGAGANVVEALLASAVGLILARLFAVPMSAIAVPLFAAAIDAASVWNGPTARLLDGGTDRVDPLSFDLPAWGDGGSAGHLGLSDALFLSMFASWSERYGFRRRPTLLGMVLGLASSPALSVAFDQAIPALPLIAAGYLLPNLDRIGRLLGHEEAAAG